MRSLTPRWKQRHQNFTKAVCLLEEAVEERAKRPLSDLEKAGLVQRYEIAWELGWKLLADCLQSIGRELDVVGPKPVIREAFAARLIEDGQARIDATNARNALSHIYNQAKADEAIDEIAAEYLALMRSLADKLSDGSWIEDSTD
jgi:nucleotidyltransferase substrate binding protein (TIGR01987 family)